VEASRVEPPATQPMDARRPGFWNRRQWYSKDTKLWPRDQWLFYGGLGKLIRDFVLPGHTPHRPLLEARDRVLTFGSCFAGELRDYLARAGFSADTFWIPEGLNNSYAILDFVSWCVTGGETTRGHRYDTDAGGKIKEWTPQQTQEHVLAHLRGAGAFVFTLGLAEVWEDRHTGAVFWRGVPKDVFDSTRHVFRTSTVEENEGNILKTIELIREVSAAPIVLTLSPVPLNGTFRDISCMTADCVSKSTLRVALDRVLDRRLDEVYYWPSFEIVRWVGGHVPWPAYGFNRGDSRHVTRYLVAEIIDAFVQAFYGPAAVDEMHRNVGWATSFERSPRSFRARVHAFRRELGHEGGRRFRRQLGRA
jgi:GSCFA family